MRRTNITKEFADYLIVAIFALIAAIFWAPESHAYDHSVSGDRVILTPRQERQREAMRAMMEANGTRTQKPTYQDQSTTQAQGTCAECTGFGDNNQFRFQDIAIFGRDQRNDKGTRYEEQTAKIQKLAQAVGIIECKSKADPKMAYFSTATVINNNRTLITAKHAFFDTVNGRDVRLDYCVFNKIDYEKNVFVTYKIEPKSIPLDGPADFEDEISIVRTINQVVGVIPLATKKITPTLGKGFLSIAFNHDIDNGENLRVQAGKTVALPSYSKLNRNNVGGHYVDTNGFASGSPLFDMEDGTIFGLHVGVETPPGKKGEKYFSTNDQGATNVFTYIK